MNKKGMLGNLIGGLVVIIIGIVMYPTMVEQIDIAAGATSNVTNIPIFDSANTLLGLLPLFFALGILMVALNLVMSMLRDVGLFGSSSKEVEDVENDEDEEEETFICVRCKQIRLT